MATLRELVAKNLARFLKEKGITQTELAKILKVSFQTVNSYMNGRSGISSDMLSKMALALNVEESDLIAIPDIERVSLPKNQFDSLIAHLETLNPKDDPNLLVAFRPAPPLIPADLLSKLSQLDEKSRNKLFKAWRISLDAAIENEDQNSDSETG